MNSAILPVLSGQDAVSNEQYMQASPYPHAVWDDFLSAEWADKAEQAFPSVQDAKWIHYVHINEKKHGLNKMDALPEEIATVIQALNSPEFVAWLSQKTGIPGLMPDPGLEGGGLHQMHRNGFLNVHADFTVHPHHRHWRRRVNVLVYLNKNWEEDFGGYLELWSKDMKTCVERVLPVYNRCVIFNTDADSYHGVPDPLQCPEDMTRKSIALYYFTEEEHIPVKRSTNYRSRPQDRSRALLIWLDKKAVEWYTRLKGWLNLDDDFMSKILNWFSRKKK